MANPIVSRLMANVEAHALSGNTAALRKSLQDLNDAIDIDATHTGNGNFQDQLMQTTAAGRGPDLKMSGDGTVVASAHSDFADQLQALTDLYSNFMKSQGKDIAEIKSVLSALLADRTGMQKAPKWDPDETVDDAKKNAADSDGAEPDDDEVEEAVKAVKSGAASVRQTMLFLRHGATKDPVKSPPDLTNASALRKAAAPSQAELDALSDSLTPQQAVQLATLRSRLSAVGHVPNLTVKSVIADGGWDRELLVKCVPHLLEQ